VTEQNTNEKCPAKPHLQEIRCLLLAMKEINSKVKYKLSQINGTLSKEEADKKGESKIAHVVLLKQS
jgi:hypothetical protein